MSSIYTSQYTPTSAVGPGNNGYTPIPGLQPLKVTDDELQFGGTAFISLFLGQVYSGDAISFNFYLGINDVSVGHLIWEVNIGGANGLVDVINASTSYAIQPNVQPVLEAYWQVKGSLGLQVMLPTTFTFSAMVFENLG